MTSEELSKILKSCGFKEEQSGTGSNFEKTIGHVVLICYIEPGMQVDFISLYKWNNNDVKGTHNVSVKELEQNKETVSTLFKKTLSDMPEYIGDTVNAHEEVRTAINLTFE